MLTMPGRAPGWLLLPARGWAGAGSGLLTARGYTRVVRLAWTVASDVRAAIYTRQSQDRSGAGQAVARQQEACEKLCADRGWSVERVLADNDTSASGSKARPAYRSCYASSTSARSMSSPCGTLTVWCAAWLTLRT